MCSRAPHAEALADARDLLARGLAAEGALDRRGAPVPQGDHRVVEVLEVLEALPPEEAAVVALDRPAGLEAPDLALLRVLEEDLHEAPRDDGPVGGLDPRRGGRREAEGDEALDGLDALAARAAARERLDARARLPLADELGLEAREAPPAEVAPSVLLEDEDRAREGPEVPEVLRRAAAE